MSSPYSSSSTTPLDPAARPLPKPLGRETNPFKHLPGYTDPTTDDLVWPPPEDTPRMVRNVLGWIGFGVGVRVYQLALQHRKQTAAPRVYLAVVAGWGTFGYYCYNWGLRQRYELAIKLKALEDQKTARRDAYQASKQEQGVALHL